MPKAPDTPEGHGAMDMHPCTPPPNSTQGKETAFDQTIGTGRRHALPDTQLCF